jgi:hypothetical protein
MQVRSPPSASNAFPVTALHLIRQEQQGKWQQQTCLELSASLHQCQSCMLRVNNCCQQMLEQQTV